MARGTMRIACHCAPLHDAEYAGDHGRTPTQAVIEAIATATDVDPTDLPALYEVVDPQTIDKLVDGGSDDDAVVGFSYEDVNLFVRGDGRIRVCDATRSVDTAPVFERSSD
jgi:hypothetical protein